FFDQRCVRKGTLRVLVKRLEVGVRRRGVEVVIAFLHVLAVIALIVRQAEQPLLQNRVSPIPQGDREAENLLVVADPEDPVLSPSVGAAPRDIVTEGVPGLATGTIVFADGSPLTLADVGAPSLPANAQRLVQTTFFFHEKPHVGFDER